jgi:hypothetical protein
VAAGLLTMATEARRCGDPYADDAIQRLGRLTPNVVHAAAERLLLDLVDAMWSGGWQPTELLRQGRRRSSAAGARLVGLAMAVDHAGRRAATLDPRWMAKVHQLDLPTVDGRPGWVRRWLAAEAMGHVGALDALVDVLVTLTGLPPLRPILPPPGTVAGGARSASADAFGAGAAGAESDPVLERIRGLLAKAESTDFEAEATALTAKAQQLMTRHAIDHATVVAAGNGSGTGGGDDEPVEVRLPVDDPYVDAKSLLLQLIAEQTRCRSVFHTNLALSTVVGFPTDVAAVELLFTSLLIQAQTALSAAARNAPAGTRVRSRSYRSAFLLSYAQRIGDRLAEINDAVLAEATETGGGAFLPVLRSRDAAVTDAVNERFGKLTSSAVRGGYDPAGWAGGRVAADNAKLAHDLVAEGAAS